MILLNNSNPLGSGAVDSADNTIQADGAAMEEDIPEDNQASVAETPAVVPSVANLISTEAAVSALIKTDSVAHAVRAAIERIQARQRQEKENQDDIDFWNSVRIFTAIVVTLVKFSLFQVCSPHCRRISKRRPGPSDDEDEDESGCGGCCSCPIPEDEDDSFLNDGFVSEAPEEVVEEIATRAEIGFTATVRFQPIMDTENLDGSGTEASSSVDVPAPPCSPARSVDSQTSQ